jgi:hypothetical protein
MTVAALNVAPPNGVGSADWALIEIEATSPTMTQGAETGRPEQAAGHDRRICVRLCSMPRPSADEAGLMAGRRVNPLRSSPLLMWRSD